MKKLKIKRSGISFAGNLSRKILLFSMLFSPFRNPMHIQKNFAPRHPPVGQISV